MRKQINNLDLIKALLIISVVVVGLLIFLLTGVFHENESITQTMEERATLVGWPSADVPLIKNKVFDIKKYGSDTNSVWEFEIESDVDYMEFAEYLVQLDDSGFKAIKEMGSQSPHLLNKNVKIEEGFSNIWYGKTDSYKITASWKLVTGNLENNLEATKSILKVTLQPIKVTSEDIFDKEEVIVNSSELVEQISGDLNFSGEISGDSGDSSIIVSGEAL